LYFDISFVMKLSIEQLGLAMETNPQHETGSWLHHGTRREHSEAEIPGDVPALEGTSRLYSIREMAQDFQVRQHPEINASC
jgi:hypothetical protein